MWKIFFRVCGWFSLGGSGTLTLTLTHRWCHTATLQVCNQFTSGVNTWPHFILLTHSSCEDTGKGFRSVELLDLRTGAASAATGAASKSWAISSWPETSETTTIATSKLPDLGLLNVLQTYFCVVTFLASSVFLQIALNWAGYPKL